MKVRQTAAVRRAREQRLNEMRERIARSDSSPTSAPALGTAPAKPALTERQALVITQVAQVMARQHAAQMQGLA